MTQALHLFFGVADRQEHRRLDAKYAAPPLWSRDFADYDCAVRFPLLRPLIELTGGNNHTTLWP
jgi:hypothetical protein